MRLRAVAMIALVLAGCGTAADQGPAQLLAPKIRVRQLAGQILPSPRSPVTEIELLVDIFNESSEPITLKRLQLQSIIGGGFRFQPTARTFNKVIPPGGVETFDLWVEIAAEAPGVDVRSPSTVRGTALFDSPAGGFRHLFTEQIVEHSRRRE